MLTAFVALTPELVLIVGNGGNEAEEEEIEFDEAVVDVLSIRFC
jgi:hypothetical protein